MKKEKYHVIIKGGNMPVISQFYGILIYMYREIGGHHNEPHVHIKYNEYD